MSNPFGIGDLPSMALPGGSGQGGGLFETMELMRKAWTSFALPPSVAPTIDPEEVERRVAELKAVEQWLVMNLTMLRGTIQALEIQQSTLAALRAFGAGSTAAMTHPMAAARTATATASPPPPPATPAAARHDATQARPAREAAQAGQAGEAGQAATAAAGHPELPGVNPMAWWETLQQQFQQVAAAALANMPAPPQAPSGGAKVKPGAAVARKSAGRKTPAKPAAPTRRATGTAGKKRAAASSRRPATEN